MGESRNLFNIPAYIKVGDKRFKVIKWGITGAVIENVPLLESEETVTADFIFPYDAYNELIIPEVKFRCSSENGTLFCKFENLKKDQEKIFKFLIREYLWRRIISIPSEFMNYTQDNEVRKELLSFQRNLTLKKKLRKVTYLLIFVVVAGAIFLSTKTLFHSENTALTVKYSEANGKKGKAAVSSNVSFVKSGAKDNSKQDSSLKPPHPKVEADSGKKTNRENEKGSSPKQISPPQVSAAANTETVKERKGESSEKTDQVQTGAKVESSVQEKGETLSRNEKYYCVQVATDVSAERLIKMAQKLKEFPYVRVEKIGKFYTLRVGFDRTYNQDKKLARNIRRKLHKKVFPRVCAYRPERWVYPQTEIR